MKKHGLRAEKPMSVSQAAAIEFKAIPEWRKIGKPQQKTHEEFLQSLSVASRVAITIAGKSKAEVVKIIEKLLDGPDGDDTAIELCDMVREGEKSARALLEIMRTANLRLLVGMAAAVKKAA